MQDLELPQLMYEIEACKRLLNFITDENVHLKNRLSEIVKDNSDVNMLVEMEDYLNKFVTQDELINLLKNDISKIETRLLGKISEDGEIIKNVYPGLRLLESNILKTEELFLALNNEFNNFLVRV